jgi:hypothetical protein
LELVDATRNCGGATKGGVKGGVTPRVSMCAVTHLLLHWLMLRAISAHVGNGLGHVSSAPACAYFAMSSGLQGGSGSERRRGAPVRDRDRGERGEGGGGEREREREREREKEREREG